MFASRMTLCSEAARFLRKPIALPCGRAHPLQPLKHFFRPSNGFLHVVADILFSNQLFERRLLNQPHGLLPRSAKNQFSAAGLQRSRGLLERK